MPVFYPLMDLVGQSDDSAWRSRALLINAFRKHRLYSYSFRVGIRRMAEDEDRTKGSIDLPLERAPEYVLQF